MSWSVYDLWKTAEPEDRCGPFLRYADDDDDDEPDDEPAPSTPVESAPVADDELPF